MNRIVLGISSYAYSWAAGKVPGETYEEHLTPTKLAQNAANLHVGAIQFGDNLPLIDYNDNELDAMYNICEKNNIAIELGTTGIDYDTIKKYAELAPKYHARIIRTLVPVSSDLSCVIDNLKKLLPILETNNVMLAMENYEGYNRWDYAYILGSLPKQYYGLCLDTANNLGRGETAEQYVELMGERICCIHVKDVGAVRLPTKMGFKIFGVPAGEGIIDIKGLIEQIFKKQESFSVILEQWPPEENDLKETLDKEDRWVNQSIEYLKTVCGGLR